MYSICLCSFFGSFITDMLPFLLVLFLDAPLTVGFFFSSALVYVLLAWQAHGGTLMSSWTVCLSVAIFANFFFLFVCFVLCHRDKICHFTDI